MYVGICLIIMAMYKSWSCVDGLLLLLLFKVCHILSLRCVTKVTKRIKSDAQPARFVTTARFVATW